jgi:hypothetical protein
MMHSVAFWDMDRAYVAIKEAQCMAHGTASRIRIWK